ncbi:MAG: redoxin domain-containing protein [Acidobacteria bacterium]|nr:redoxin domain-containing protein [Acidobacteriota bacterium]
MLGRKPYNYRRFTREQMVTNATANAPAPGERAPDFETRTLEGDLFRLGDYAGSRNLVLTFGSATCPITAGSIHALDELYADYAGEGIEFLFVYVREAHPGGDLPAHESMQQKIAAAELLRREEDVHMPIAVDDLKGSIHRHYGKLPNPTYVIDKSGRIAFRSLWSRPAEVRAALEELLERQEERGVQHAIVHGGEDTAMPVSRALLHAHRAVERGGEAAIQDFREAMGFPGRVALATSSVMEPVTLHPLRVLSGALLASGVIAGALYAGHKLRQRRFGFRSPYDIHVDARRNLLPGDEYEAVGI